MRFTYLGAAAALAAVSQAFLIPSTMSTDSKDASPVDLDITELVTHRLLRVKCPECTMKTMYGSLSQGGNSESALGLSFELDPANSTLTVNGHQIWPIGGGPVSSPLRAPQIIGVNGVNGKDDWVWDGIRTLGFHTKAHRVPKSKDGLSIIYMKFDIFMVDSKFSNGIPGVNIVLLQTASGQLKLSDTSIALNRASYTPLDVGRDCKTLLCKWKAIVAAKAATLKKGCSGFKRPHKSAPHPPNTIPGRPHGIKGGPNKFAHPRPHGVHSHGSIEHERERVSKLLHSFTFNIVVMIFLGVFFFLAARVAGYLVGTFAIFVWRMLFRFGQRGQYTRVEVDETSADEVEDEKEAFLESQGPPPLYEDPKIVVVEKSEQE